MFALLLLVPAVISITFKLSAGTTKCFTEELPGDQHYKVVWSAEKGYSQFIDLKLTSPTDQVLQEDKSADSGVIYFFVTTAGMHTLCFTNRIAAGVKYPSPDLHRKVSLIAQNDIQDIENYDSYARQEHLQPAELNLRIMEGNVQRVHSEYYALRDHEIHMTQRHEGTLKLVKVVSACSILAYIIFFTVQAWYLKRYLRRVKIIES